jgi:hypothetical protein
VIEVSSEDYERIKLVGRLIENIIFFLKVEFLMSCHDVCGSRDSIGEVAWLL